MTTAEQVWVNGVDVAKSDIRNYMARIAAGASAFIVKNDTETEPAANPATGDSYIVAAGATGAWSGHDGHISIWNGAEWVYLTPLVGWSAYATDSGSSLVHDGAEWAEHSGGGSGEVNTSSNAGGGVGLSMLKNGADLPFKSLLPGSGIGIAENVAGTEVTISATGGGGQSIIVVDQKPTGVNGGTFAAGAWRTRDANLILHNNILGASVASNRITLPPGDYTVSASAPSLSVKVNALRLRDVTNSTTLVGGQNGYASNEVTIASLSVLQGGFTLAAITEIELQHRGRETKTSNGFGYNTASIHSEPEIYACITINKV